MGTCHNRLGAWPHQKALQAPPCGQEYHVTPELHTQVPASTTDTISANRSNTCGRVLGTLKDIVRMFRFVVAKIVNDVSVCSITFAPQLKSLRLKSEIVFPEFPTFEKG